MNKRQRGAWAVAIVLGMVIGADFAGGHRVLQQDTAVQSELVTETTRKDSASQVIRGIHAVPATHSHPPSAAPPPSPAGRGVVLGGHPPPVTTPLVHGVLPQALPQALLHALE